MASSLNKVMVIGNVGRDPEMRYTADGNAMTTFSVATNHVSTATHRGRRTSVSIGAEPARPGLVLVAERRAEWFRGDVAT